MTGLGVLRTHPIRGGAFPDPCRIIRCLSIMGSHQAISVARRTQGLAGDFNAYMTPMPFTSPSKRFGFALLLLGKFPLKHRNAWRFSQL